MTKVWRAARPGGIQAPVMPLFEGKGRTFDDVGMACSPPSSELAATLEGRIGTGYSLRQIGCFLPWNDSSALQCWCGVVPVGSVRSYRLLLALEQLLC